MIIDMSVAVERKGTTLPRIMANPLTPPVVKLLGILKKYTPTVKSRIPKLTNKKALMLATVKSFPVFSRSTAMVHPSTFLYLRPLPHRLSAK